MTGMHAKRWCALAACLAAMLALALPASAQNLAGPAVGKDSAGRKKAALPKSSRALEQKPAPAPAAEKKQSRHIGKFHIHLRKHAKHIRHLQNDEDDYTRFVKKLDDEFHLKVLLSPTIMTQWGSPDGGPAATQVVVSPIVHWEMFKSPLGDGTFDYAYISNRYYAAGQSAASLTGRLNLLSPINDTPVSNRTFNQLTYSHEFPGDVLLIGVGQFPLSNFDASKYAGNQQTGFINYALSQNASQTYPVASLGAWGQVALIPDTLEVVVGYQDANNVSGNNIQTTTVSAGAYTTFAYVQWTPKFSGLGDAQYSVLYYHQPCVLLQPAVSDGWSVNATQDLNENWAVFMRANATTGPLSPIKDSIGAGFVYKDVLGRAHDNDQIGVAISRNTANMDLFVGGTVRAHEWLVEVYWNTLIWRHFIVGPDVQVYIDPALNPGQSTVQVYTLRLTGLF
jgi:hypothetical protein